MFLILLLRLLIIIHAVIGFSFRSSNTRSIPSEESRARQVTEFAASRKAEIDALSGRLVSSGLDLNLTTVTKDSTREKPCHAQIFSSWNREFSKDTDRPYCSLVTESDVHRTAFAARLTVCELEQNQLNIPKECTIWIEKGDLDARSCVTALHASPQSWSSYSGHQRDAIQLCFGYVNVHGLDKAKEVYENTSVIANQLLVSLYQREQARQKEFIDIKRDLTQHFRTEVDSVKLMNENGRIRLEEISTIIRSNLRNSQELMTAHQNTFEDLISSLERRITDRDETDRRKRDVEFSTSLKLWIGSTEEVYRKLNAELGLELSTRFHTLQQELSSGVDTKLDQSLEFMTRNLDLEFRDLAISLGKSHDSTFENVKSALLVQENEIINSNDRLFALSNGLSKIEERMESLDQNSNQISNSLVQSGINMVDLEQRTTHLMDRIFEKLDIQVGVVENLTDSLVSSMGRLDHMTTRSIRWLFSSLQSIILLGFKFSSDWTTLPWIIYNLTLHTSKWLINGFIGASFCILISIFKKIHLSRGQRRPGNKIRRHGRLEDCNGLSEHQVKSRTSFGQLAKFENSDSRHRMNQVVKPNFYPLEDHDLELQDQSMSLHLREFDEEDESFRLRRRKLIQSKLDVSPKGQLGGFRSPSHHRHHSTRQYSRIVPARLTSDQG